MLEEKDEQALRKKIEKAESAVMSAKDKVEKGGARIEKQNMKLEADREALLKLEAAGETI